MRILFIVPYPTGRAPSQRFRFEQYYPLLTEKGYQYEIAPFLSESTWKILYTPGNKLNKALGIMVGFWKRFLLLFGLGKYDWIFIHREASPIGPPIFEWIIAKVLGKKIIYDFDDAIWLPNTSENNRIVADIKWHSKVGSICKWAYKVSCGNDYLCDYARQFNPNVVLNPTTIDTEHHHNKVKQHREGEIPVLGWTGTHSTIQYLDMVVPILQKLESQLNFRFVVISNRKPDIQLASLEYIEWSKATEIEDLLRFDVGIMPLTEDKWAKGKCGFKALQYMALGIPAITSPVGVNTKIVDAGINGFLCDNSQEWEQAINTLLMNPQMRISFGRKAREKIENHFSVRANSSNFLSLVA
ncbi:MAG: glycosyltransferase [Chitinophagales bacterium]|nr:glycosyltransferase [Chitinophagales bacterium]